MSVPNKQKCGTVILCYESVRLILRVLSREDFLFLALAQKGIYSHIKVLLEEKNGASGATLFSTPFLSAVRSVSRLKYVLSKIWHDKDGPKNFIELATSHELTYGLADWKGPVIEARHLKIKIKDAALRIPTHIFWTVIFDLAVQAGSVDVLAEFESMCNLHDDVVPALGYSTCSISHSGSIGAPPGTKCIEFDKPHTVLLPSQQTWEIGAKFGHLEVLKLLGEKTISGFNMRTIAGSAAEGGFPTIIEWLASCGNATEFLDEKVLPCFLLAKQSPPYFQTFLRNVERFGPFQQRIHAKQIPLMAARGGQLEMLIDHVGKDETNSFCGNLASIPIVAEAALFGRLNVVEYCVESVNSNGQEEFMVADEAILAAASGGNVNILQFFKQYAKISPTAIRICPRAQVPIFGNRCRISCSLSCALKNADGLHGPIDTRMTCAAASSGDIETLNFALDEGFGYESQTYTCIARSGTAEMFELLCDFDKRDTSGKSYWNLDLTSDQILSGPYCIDECVRAATKAGNLDIVRFIYEERKILHWGKDPLSCSEEEVKEWQIEGIDMSSYCGNLGMFSVKHADGSESEPIYHSSMSQNKANTWQWSLCSLAGLYGHTHILDWVEALDVCLVSSLQMLKCRAMARRNYWLR